MNRRFRLADTNGDLFQNLPMEVEKNWIGFDNIGHSWSVTYRGMRDRHWWSEQDAQQARMVYEMVPQAFDMGAALVRWHFEQLFKVSWHN